MIDSNIGLPQLVVTAAGIAYDLNSVHPHLNVTTGMRRSNALHDQISKFQYVTQVQDELHVFFTKQEAHGPCRSTCGTQPLVIWHQVKFHYGNVAD